MGYMTGENRHQAAMLPATIEEYVDDNAPVRVIDAFITGLDFSALGFERAKPASTGRPGYDPRDLLKLYVYGYLNEVRSSRRLERECRRNLEVTLVGAAPCARPQDHRRLQAGQRSRNCRHLPCLRTLLPRSGTVHCSSRCH
jgi:transposase